MFYIYYFEKGIENFNVNYKKLGLIQRLYIIKFCNNDTILKFLYQNLLYGIIVLVLFKMFQNYYSYITKF